MSLRYLEGMHFPVTVLKVQLAMYSRDNSGFTFNIKDGAFSSNNQLKEKNIIKIASSLVVIMFLSSCSSCSMNYGQGCLPFPCPQEVFLDYAAPLGNLFFASTTKILRDKIPLRMIYLEIKKTRLIIVCLL